MAQVVLEVSVILGAVNKALHALRSEQDHHGPAWVEQEQALEEVQQIANWTINNRISDSLHIALTMKEIHLIELYILKRR